MNGSLGRKQETTDSLGGSQIWRTVSAGSENQRTHLYPVCMIIIILQFIGLDITFRWEVQDLHSQVIDASYVQLGTLYINKTVSNQDTHTQTPNK